MPSKRMMLSNVRACLSVTARLGVSALLLLGGTAAFAQTTMPMSAPPAQEGMTNAADQNKQLADQIAELRAQVTRLQAAVQQTGPGKKVSPKSGMNMNPSQNKGMGMKDDESEMGMPPGKGAMASGSAAMGMKDDQSEMGDKDEMGGMPMGNSSRSPDPAMGMCCGGKRASGGNAAMNAMPPDTGGMATMNGSSSAMPGQAGASHIYHIGSNGFFLNHSRHITLTPDQRLTLNHIKEKAMLESASEQRRIDQAEQELYTLTGTDEPDNAKIQAKIFEIEKLRAGQRMNFIRAVEEASNVLTPEQRTTLLGTMAATRK